MSTSRFSLTEQEQTRAEALLVTLKAAAQPGAETTIATMITIALAMGRSETWVADRTGHKSSTMINRYSRAARTAAELGLGDLTPLDVAIPELPASSSDSPSGGTGSNGDAPPRRVVMTIPTRTRPASSTGRPGEKGEAKRRKAMRAASGGSGQSPKSPSSRAGTEGGTRTHKPLRIADFESAASAIPPLRLESERKVVHLGARAQPPRGPGCVLL